MAGVEEALAAGRDLGVTVVPGVEISVKGPSGSMHLLGYFRVPRPEPVWTRIEEIAAFRASRNRRIVDRLGELGVPVDWSDVEARAKGQVGRPHIAEALVAAGHVETKQEAFDVWLAAGMPAYVEAGSLNPSEATELIVESGGAPVLAHPGSLKLDDDGLSVVVEEMTAAGMRGLEVYRPDHDAERRAAYLALCDRFGLVPSGGSDFHRVGPEGLEPGNAGEVALPPDTLDRLLPSPG
jgi:predicted metal-dependent phosphoesterase TrpH